VRTRAINKIQATVIVLQDQVRTLTRTLAQTKASNRKNPDPFNVTTAAQKAFDAEEVLRDATDKLEELQKSKEEWYR